MSVNTTEALRQQTDAEREFIDGAAAYYQMNDGMPLARGRLIGWLVICDPPTQSARSLSAKVGCDESDVDYILGLLVPSGVLQRSEAPARSTAGPDTTEGARLGAPSWRRRISKALSPIRP